MIVNWADTKKTIEYINFMKIARVATPQKLFIVFQQIDTTIKRCDNITKILHV